MLGLFQPPDFTFKGSWRHRGSLACFSYFLFSIFCWNVPLTNSVLDRGPYWESALHSWRSTAECVRVGRGVFVGLLPSSPSQCSFSTDGEEFHHTHSYTHTYKNLFLFYCSVYLDTLTHTHSDGQQRRSHWICPLKEPGRFDVSSERDVIISCIFEAFEWKKWLSSQALAVLVLTPEIRLI